jgi:hypothetical protein
MTDIERAAQAPERVSVREPTMTDAPVPINEQIAWFRILLEEAHKDLWSADEFPKMRAILATLEAQPALLAVVEAARKLEFSAYPAHGSGLVTIVTAGDIGELQASLGALPPAPDKEG